MSMLVVYLEMSLCKTLAWYKPLAILVPYVQLITNHMNYITLGMNSTYKKSV